MLCEESMTTIEARSALSVPQSTKQVAPTKTQSNTRQTLHKLWDDESQCGDMQKEETIEHGGNHKRCTTDSKTTKDIFICMPHLWFEWT